MLRLYYKLRKNAYVRSFDDVGYIVSTGRFHDRVVDSVGAVFLSALSRAPQSLDELAEKIAASFADADLAGIKNDAAEFYGALTEDGFLLTGDSATELEGKESGFSYAVAAGLDIATDFSPDIKPGRKDTQTLLAELFQKRPHLHSFQIEL